MKKPTNKSESKPTFTKIILQKEIILPYEIESFEDLANEIICNDDFNASKAFDSWLEKGELSFKVYKDKVWTNPTKQASFARQTNLARLLLLQPSKPNEIESQPSKPKRAKKAFCYSIQPCNQVSKQKPFYKPLQAKQSKANLQKPLFIASKRRAKRAKQSEQGESQAKSKARKQKSKQANL